MSNRKLDEKKDLLKKIDYIGLDFNNIPKSIKSFESLDFRISKTYDEKVYRQYRYIPVKDIQILLSPTNRLDDLQEKYTKASPLIEYLDDKTEENFIKYTTFLNMLKSTKIEDIEKIEKEQENLNKNIPFKVKFEGNYLWQIYYSENTDKYFMIVPTEDSDYSTFFFLLKKQLENKMSQKIFVPISNVQYSRKYLKKSQFEDIDNYLWLFTKDWPLVYEVYDKSNKMSIQIIGETKVYDNIKSLYKVKLNSEVDADKFYKLLKAMFILQTELPHYYNFTTNINRNGKIEFYFEQDKIEYSKLSDWIKEQYVLAYNKKENADILIIEYKKKLDILKQEISTLEIEYLDKEKQISTFLECKKSFFGKFKYYFKYSKKNKNIYKNANIQNENVINLHENRENIKQSKRFKENYTIEELIEVYKNYEIQENEIKNTLMDINALKLKIKNIKKKIENASLYIQEIDNHKKSIFEFWKYSNKDEISVLPEGEKEEINVIKKVTKIFDYNEDIENFGKDMDKMQRKLLSKDETDSLYIASTNMLDILNSLRNNKLLPKDIDNSLKQIKKEAEKDKILLQKDNFDIFGGIIDDSTKIKNIAGKKHRELPKDKYKILDISKNTKQIGYKLSLEQILNNIKSALDKVRLKEDVPVYKAMSDNKINQGNISVFNINPENEIKSIEKQDKNKINFYKINLKQGVNILVYTNIMFYDNQNKTLPLGMDLSTKVLVDLSKLQLRLVNKATFRIAELEDEKNDFSNINIKNVNVFEYNV